MGKSKTQIETRPSEKPGTTWTPESELAAQRKAKTEKKFGVPADTGFAALKDQAITVREELGEALLIEDKDALLDTEMALVNWVFNPGDFANEDGSNRPFVSVYAITVRDERIVFNDGGTGIMSQLAGKTAPPEGGPVLLAKGLTKSEYYTCPIHKQGVGNQMRWDLHVKQEHQGESVQPIESVTYYLN